MQNVRIEEWNGYKIRFVEKSPGEWWAVLKDITDALGLKTWKVNQRMDKGLLSKYTLQTLGGPQEMLIINEIGIYDAIFSSRKKEAREFKHWVFNMLKTLRQSTGLEGFQVFRMLDKEHQKEAMARLKASLENPVRVDFIKANTIANKAISIKYDRPKMLKKGQMTPQMLAYRQQVLEDTVNLMGVVDKFKLPVSVSQAIYGKYAQ